MAISSTFNSSDGGGYELQMGRWSRRLAPKFIEFAGVENADCVLDVGCGTGSLTSTLALNLNIRGLHGVDFSAAYVSTLTPEGKAILQDKVRLAYMDGEADGPRSYAAIAWAVKGTVPI